MNKNAIKKFAIEARKKLIDSVTDKAGMLGITEKSCSEPSTKGPDFEVYQTVAGTEVTLNKKQCDYRKKLVEYINDKGFDYVIEEVSYTWFNRICAIRFMEVNDYLPFRTRVLSSEKEEKNEPDIITNALDIDMNFSASQKEYIIQCKVDNRMDEVFNFLFLKVCAELSEYLPGLFEKTKDFFELLLNISYIDPDGIIYKLTHDIAEKDFDVANGGQVEVIGWLYQYYISDKHDEVVNVRKKNVLSKNDLPAATQIFTPDWIVKYMVENSLGKYWKSVSDDSAICDKFELYLNTEEVHATKKNKIEQIKFYDPCMGSGHILVYAFDVFLEIYKEVGYTERDAAEAILKNNIYGVDIDKRAYQLAYFSLFMKARKYDRRILTKNIELNITYIEEPLKKLDKTILPVDIIEQVDKLYNEFEQARECGSLLYVDLNSYRNLKNYICNYEMKEDYGLTEYAFSEYVMPNLQLLLKQVELLGGKYEIVCTNPPYTNKINAYLQKYLDNKFEIARGDLFSAFIKRNLDYCTKEGFVAMMTPHVWMFIKSYEKLRKYIIDNKSISTLIHLAKGAFYTEAAVDICSFVLRNNDDNLPGKYVRLDSFKGDMDVQCEMTKKAITTLNCDYIYTRTLDEYYRIDGAPFSYWIGENIYKDFEKGTPLKLVSPPRQGMATTNNNKFLRFWYEIDFGKIGFGMKNEDESAKSGKRYFPYNKGGEFRRWYGNNYYVVNFENHGKEVCDYIDIAGAPKFNHKNRVINREYYFKKCITWSDISADFSGRYCPEGFIFDIKGSCGFPPENKIYYILGLLNSKLTQMFIDILNPTITTQVGDMARIPVMYGNESEIEGIVKQCVDISKEYWDSREISWDYMKCVLIDSSCTKIKEKLYSYNDTLLQKRNILIENEKKLNAKFIDIYGLNGFIDETIREESVGVNKRSEKELIIDFISYAVGCMFGRYSLIKEGLIYAGGVWNKNNYRDYLPDEDNCIPITDEEYFSDDIVTRFVEFVKTVYGADTLEENLDFIANALGNKGDTSREVIRNYFLKDFYADHLKVYQKRPIYWLFDSGKQNGFKALIYMHRYDADTVGRVRTDYLHRAQKYVETAMQSAQYTIDNASSASEKSKATKAVTKYTKQLAEMKIYDEAIAHIANKRIEIDLDDGVKVNYEKFQGVEVAQEGKKALKVDLLAKLK